MLVQVIDALQSSPFKLWGGQPLKCTNVQDADQSKLLLPPRRHTHTQTQLQTQTHAGDGARTAAGAASQPGSLWTTAARVAAGETQQSQLLLAASQQPQQPTQQPQLQPTQQQGHTAGARGGGGASVEEYVPWPMALPASASFWRANHANTGPQISMPSRPLCIFHCSQNAACGHTICIRTYLTPYDNAHYWYVRVLTPWQAHVLTPVVRMYVTYERNAWEHVRALSSIRMYVVRAGSDGTMGADDHETGDALAAAVAGDWRDDPRVAAALARRAEVRDAERAQWSDLRAFLNERDKANEVSKGRGT